MDVTGLGETFLKSPLNIIMFILGLALCIFGIIGIGADKKETDPNKKETDPNSKGDQSNLIPFLYSRQTLTSRLVLISLGSILMITSLVLTLLFPALWRTDSGTSPTFTPYPTVTSAPAPTVATSAPTPTPTTAPSLSGIRIEPGDATMDTLPFGEAHASCKAGETIVGGGYASLDREVPLLISQSYPNVKPNDPKVIQWTVKYSLWQPNSNTLATPTSGRMLLTPYAFCIPLSGTSIKTEVIQGTYKHIPATGTIALYAQCDPDYTLLSGGYDLPYDLHNDAHNVPQLQYYGFATASYPPTQGSGWHVDAKWGSGPSSDPGEGGSAYVLCGKGTALAGQSQLISGQYALSHAVSCPNGQIATGGGYHEESQSDIPGFISDGPSPDSSTFQQWPIQFGNATGKVTLYSVCVRFVTS